MKQNFQVLFYVTKSSGPVLTFEESGLHCCSAITALACCIERDTELYANWTNTPGNFIVIKKVTN